MRSGTTDCPISWSYIHWKSSTTPETNDATLPSTVEKSAASRSLSQVLKLLYSLARYVSIAPNTLLTLSHQAAIPLYVPARIVLMSSQCFQTSYTAITPSAIKPAGPRNGRIAVKPAPIPASAAAPIGVEKSATSDESDTSTG